MRTAVACVKRCFLHHIQRRPLCDIGHHAGDAELVAHEDIHTEARVSATILADIPSKHPLAIVRGPPKNDK